MHAMQSTICCSTSVYIRQELQYRVSRGKVQMFVNVDCGFLAARNGLVNKVEFLGFSGKD